MSGHNKWSKIKHKKAATDAAKSKVFSKYSKLIAVESKLAGGNIDSPGLKAVIDRAKKENMPNDNIDRAVKKGMSGESDNLEAVTYETYGPGGSAVLIDALTDNRNRTGAEIKHTLSKNGYELAAPGSASWAFTKENGEWIPNQTIPLGEDDTKKLDKLIDVLNENDDVSDIYTNAE